MTRDLRHYARQTRFRLILGALALIFFVGDGLIYLIYGPQAAVMGLVCLLAGMIPILLTVLALVILEWFVKRSKKS